MARYSTSFDKYAAFKIDKEFVADVHRLCKVFSGDEVDCTFQLEGNHDISSKVPEELFDDTLVKSRTIERISIYGSNYRLDPSPSVSVSITNKPLSAPVEVRISGAPEACVVLRDQLQNLVHAKQQWYSMLILQFPSFRWVVIVLGWATLWLFLLAWLESRLNVRNYVGKDGLSTIFGVEFAAVLFLSSWFKKLLFPAVVFDFGKSATVGQKIAYARNTIFVIIGLGLMVGIVASVVGNWISSAKPP